MTLMDPCLDGATVTIGDRAVARLKPLSKRARERALRAVAPRGSHELLHGRWQDLIGRFPAHSFDAIITDPPYKITDADNETSRRKLNGWREGNMAPLGAEGAMDWDKPSEGGPDEDYAWLAAVMHLLRPGGAIISFCDAKQKGLLWEYMAKAGAVPKQPLYWIKTNPPTNPRQNYQSGVEEAVFGRKPGKIVYWGGGGANLNYLSCPTVHHAHRVHRTQKPVPVLEWLIRDHVPIGGRFLDLFAGSGSSLVAGEKLGVHGVGFEMGDDEYAKAQEWIAAELAKAFPTTSSRSA